MAWGAVMISSMVASLAVVTVMCDRSSVNYPKWSAHGDALPVYRNGTRLSYNKRKNNFVTLYFDENEVSRLEWISLSQWESDADRYKTVSAIIDSSHRIVVWIGEQNEPGFYDIDRQSANTFGGTTGNATEVLVVLHYSWNRYHWTDQTYEQAPVVTIAGTDVEFIGEKLHFKPNEASEIQWVPATADVVSSPIGGIFIVPNVVVAKAKVNITSTSNVTACAYNLQRKCCVVADYWNKCTFPDIYEDVKIAIVKHYPRFVGATSKRHGSPYAEDVNLDDTFKSIVPQANPDSHMIDIPLFHPIHHLEVHISIPPHLPPRPRGNSVRMVIDFEQALQTSVCDTPGLTLFTTDGRDGNRFRECGILGSQSCKFLCVGSISPDMACGLFVRMELPVYGDWDIPSKIKAIKHLWLTD